VGIFELDAIHFYADEVMIAGTT